jgi:hypothetical protein
MSRDYYRVEVASDQPGCRYCGHGKFWTVIYSEADGDILEVGTAWADRDVAEDICDLMNMAYEAGIENNGQ